MPRGRGRRETNARLQHPHITMHSWHNKICISDRSPKHKHLYTKPASHESSFNSANHNNEILMPLSSPHRRLQWPPAHDRATEVFTPSTTVYVLIFCLDTRAGILCVFNFVLALLIYIPRATRIEPFHIVNSYCRVIFS